MIIQDGLREGVIHKAEFGENTDTWQPTASKNEIATILGPEDVERGGGLNLECRKRERF